MFAICYVITYLINPERWMKCIYSVPLFEKEGVGQIFK